MLLSMRQVSIGESAVHCDVIMPIIQYIMTHAYHTSDEGLGLSHSIQCGNESLTFTSPTLHFGVVTGGLF